MQLVMVIIQIVPARGGIIMTITQLIIRRFEPRLAIGPLTNEEGNGCSRPGMLYRYLRSAGKQMEHPAPQVRHLPWHKQKDEPTDQC